MADGGAVSGGVVVGDEEDDEGHEESDERSKINAVGGGDLAVVTKPFGEKHMGERPEGCSGGEGTDKNAKAEKAGGVPFAEVDGKNAENGGEDRDAADDEGVSEGSGIGLAIAPEDGEVGYENTADEADGVGFKDIGGHPSAIADVIADVVGNGGGVTRVIFFELGFEFADKVGADIGGFGVDASAQTSEDADERGSESESGETVDGGTETEPAGSDEIESANGEKGEGDDEEAGDGATVEGITQGGGTANGGGLGGANVGHDGDSHTCEASDEATGGADDKADSSGKIFQVADRSEKKKGDEGNGLELAVEIGSSPFLNGGRDFAHTFAAFGLAFDPDDEPEGRD